MPFRVVTGHRPILRLLARAVARNTLPPALLFAGPGGVGKRLSATAVAQALNCLQPSASDDFELDACGACPACLRIARDVHPDVVVIEPGDTGKIKVDQIRDVIERTQFRPFEGRRRVVIVDEADAMVSEAQSALLKTLEEPPSSSVFILVSAIHDSLLPTVRSRCPLLRFGSLTTVEVASLLIERHEYTASDAESAAREAGGSVARALEASSVDLIDARASAQRLLERAARAGGPAARLEAAEIVKAKVKNETPAEERSRLATCLRSLSSLLRDVGVIATQADARLLANADLEAELRRLAPAFDEERWRNAFAAVDEALAALQRNASPKIVADWLVLRL